MLGRIDVHTRTFYYIAKKVNPRGKAPVPGNVVKVPRTQTELAKKTLLFSDWEVPTSSDDLDSWGLRAEPVMILQMNCCFLLKKVRTAHCSLIPRSPFHSIR